MSKRRKHRKTQVKEPNPVPEQGEAVLETPEPMGWRMWGLLALVVAVGAFFRLYQLGYAAMRGDTIIYWCSAIPNAVPYSMNLTTWFVTTFDLVDSVFARRLPSAVWGILMVPVAFGLGRSIRDNRLGFLMAAMAALNPFCIQCAREAYFYAPLTLGAFLAIWAAVDIFKYNMEQAPLTARSHVVNLLGFLFLTCVHPPGWPLAVGLGFVNVFMIRRRIRRGGHRFCAHDAVILGMYLLVALFVAKSPWGPLAVVGEVTKGTTATTASVWSEHGSSLELLFRSFTSLAWGSSPVRLVFSAVVVLLGLVYSVRKAQDNSLYWLIIDLILFGGTVQIFARKITMSPYEVRYLLPVYPAYLALQALGLLSIAGILARFRRGGPWVQRIMLVLALWLWIPPDIAVTQLEGHVNPYNEITEWVDSNLRPNSLVLVDRWLETENELIEYDSTNVAYTFTIPNEPVEAYVQNNWRQTVQEFMGKYPQSAFLEIRKSYWEHPQVGPWRWPERYFNQHVSFTNEAALKLRKWGLGSRSDFYTMYTNGIVVDLYYDTREDILNRAQGKGMPVIAFYGEGWFYSKPWQLAEDFYDWRVLEESATIDAYNLTDKDQDVVISIAGFSVMDNKTLSIPNAGKMFFPLDEFVKRFSHKMTIPPGHTELVVTDPVWMSHPTMLMVAHMSCDLYDESMVPQPDAGIRPSQTLDMDYSVPFYRPDLLPNSAERIAPE